MERVKIKKIKKNTKYIVSKKLEKALAYLESKASLSNKKCQKHVRNKHKKIKYTQIKALKTIENELEDLFSEIRFTFDLNDFDQIKDILPKKEILFNSINSRIQDQVSRTRTEESSPKNTTLFFGILSETKDLIAATMNLIELYYIDYDSDIDPLIKKNSES